MNKNQEEMKNTISEMKITTKEIKSRLEEAEDQISELENKAEKNTQSEQQQKKTQKERGYLKGVSGQHEMKPRSHHRNIRRRKKGARDKNLFEKIMKTSLT